MSLAEFDCGCIIVAGDGVGSEGVAIVDDGQQQQDQNQDHQKFIQSLVQKLPDFVVKATGEFTPPSES